MFSSATLLTLLCLIVPLSAHPFDSAPPTGDVTLWVRSDGTGNFTSVQSALDFLAPGSNADLRAVTLYLKGYFHERVWVYSNFSYGVTFIGEGSTPLESLMMYNVSGASVGTWASWTVLVDANNFTAQNVAFGNNAGNYNKTVAAQSCALMLYGDFNVLDGVALLGAQDTLFTGNGRLYMTNSYINGSCDSIFGYGAAVFSTCTVDIFDTVTAQKGNGSTAYLILNSDILPATGPNTTYLGRPWDLLARTVFYSCYLSDAIYPLGWNDWQHGCTNKSNATACDNVFYAEYNSTGPGANPDARAWWTYQLTAQQAQVWNVTTVLSGWDPRGEGRGENPCWDREARARFAGYDSRLLI